MKRVAVLGATGSIGTSTLDVLARNPDGFAVQALAANSSVSAMLDACRRFRPQKAVLRDPDLRIGEAPFLTKGRKHGRTKAFTLGSVLEALMDVYNGHRSVQSYREKIIEQQREP